MWAGERKRYVLDAEVVPDSARAAMAAASMAPGPGPGPPAPPKGRARGRSCPAKRAGLDQRLPPNRSPCQVTEKQVFVCGGSTYSV